VNFALFFWEESLIPATTIATLNTHFNGVLAPSQFVMDALLRSGLTVPVHCVGLAPDLEPFQRLRRTASEVTRFLHISSGFPRKGVDVLLRAYAKAFRPDDPVELVIKTFPNPHNDMAAQLAAYHAAVPDLAPIRLINVDLAEADILELYRNADVMVLPSRGEGFNLPAAEAMAAGLGVIVSEIGGHADFCTSATARLVACRSATAASHLSVLGSVWAEPVLTDLVAALREATAGPDNPRLARAAIVVAEMTPDRLASRISQAALAHLEARISCAGTDGQHRDGIIADLPTSPIRSPPDLQGCSAIAPTASPEPNSDCGAWQGSSRSRRSD
jgi:glycosyltransferase involved in cell wall biosynthesis